MQKTSGILERVYNGRAVSPAATRQPARRSPAAVRAVIALAALAIALPAGAARKTPDQASRLSRLGGLAVQRGNLVLAQKYSERALALRQRQAPDSTAVADSLYQVGEVAYLRGDDRTAVRYLERARALQEQRAPGSIDLAYTLERLGELAQKRAEAVERADPAAARSDYRRALALYGRALAIWERRAPNSLTEAATLYNLGSTARSLGDVRQAKTHFLRALSIYEKRAPGTLDEADVLNHLASLAFGDGSDLRETVQYYRRELAIREKRSPGSARLAQTLTDLGRTLDQQQKGQEALPYYRRALAIYEKRAPNSLALVDTLYVVAQVAPDEKTAESCYRRMVPLYERLAPHSEEFIDVLNHLGDGAQLRGDLAAATAYHRRAKAIRKAIDQQAPAASPNRPAAQPAAEGTNAEHAASKDHLGKLGQALMMYCQNYEETFPPIKDAAAAKKLLLPYAGRDQDGNLDETIFTNPETGEPYQPNPSLAGRALAQLEAPAQMVGFYEAHPASDGTRGVVFADGHVQRIPEKDWARLKQASGIP